MRWSGAAVWISAQGCASVGLAALLATGCSERAPASHLVLITVDTLRADHLGSYGSALAATPRLDALASTSVRFETARAPAPFTLASVAGLMTGRHPVSLGVTDNLSALPVDLPTIATRLHERGWRTGAVVSSLVLKIADPLHAGFDAFDAQLPEIERVRWWVHERSAAATSDAALAMLARLHDGSGAPTFLWVHYQDPHGPYTPPAGERERFLEDAGRAPDAGRELELTSAAGIGGLPRYQFIAPHREVAFYRAGYAGEIHSVDAEIGRLLDAVDARADRAPTAVIFTADHGEDLGEGDHWFAHGSRLGEPSLRVPLLVRAPGLAPAVRGDPASALDILPTVAGLVGLAANPEWTGRDLLSDAMVRPPPLLLVSGESEDAPRSRGIVEDGYKLVQTRALEDITRIYRLPDESADRSTEQPELLRSLSQALEAGFAALADPAAKQRMGLRPEELEGLRAMGYVEEPAAP